MPAEQDLKDMLVALTDGKSCMDCGAHPVSELCGPTCHSKHEKGCPKHEIQYVVGFLFNPARRAVLLLQKTHPEWQFGMWNGPGGKLEPGEAPAATMRREFLEETGLDIAAWDRYAELSGPGFRIFLFRAFSETIWSGKSMTDEVVDRFPIDDLPERIMTNAAWLIPMALSMDQDRAAGFVVQELAA